MLHALERPAPWCAALALCASLLPAQSPPQRPRDPWVFRSVLDGRARMVTIALSNELWAAYDASTCSLYKAWRGGVNFDGAVYTTVHGPQPTSEGPAYAAECAGEAWWVTQPGAEPRSVRPRWRGYAFDEGQVRLRYEFVLDGGAVVRVEETPELVRPEKQFDDPTSQAPWLVKGLVGLRRTFQASGLPEGTALSVAFEADCAGYLMERLTGVDDREVALADGSKGRHVRGRLPLEHSAPSNDLMLFFRPFPEERAK